MASAQAFDRRTRIAIVDENRCKPKKCGLVCKSYCPVNRIGKNCIDVDASSKVARIAEVHCIGCGICVKKCPFNAISIINLPSNLKTNVTHRYGSNSFKLHGLPVPRFGNVLGIVGSNGIGKSTALDILAGKLKPNLGLFDNAPDWQQIVTSVRGSGLQKYFKRLVEENLKPVKKLQRISQICQAYNGTVGELLTANDQLENGNKMCELLGLSNLINRNIGHLSGGELQRFAIALTCIQKADIYMFDEPSSFLDIKQRLNCAKAIRSLVNFQNCVIVVEHDLALLDYLSDYICILYGVPTAYGVVTMSSSVRDGINIYLDGFLPSENMRFRESPLNFKVSQDKQETYTDSVANCTSYPFMKKVIDEFELTVEPGQFRDSQIIVLLGENGTGKTTMIKLLAGKLLPDDDNSQSQLPKMIVSYKPQKVSLTWSGSVRDLLLKTIRDAYVRPDFVSDVIKPLQIQEILNLEVQNLSGGELQRVSLAMCLGRLDADLYLIDEPSAYLDCEQRLEASKVIKRFVLHNKKTAFVVEHDFMMATYLADSVIVFEGEPSKSACATSPKSLLSGMNKFLAQLDVTVRRDKTNYRPRINKRNGVQDVEQKKSGNYFFTED